MFKGLYNAVTFVAALIVIAWAGWETYLHWPVITGKAEMVLPHKHKHVCHNKACGSADCTCGRHCQCNGTDKKCSPNCTCPPAAGAKKAADAKSCGGKCGNPDCTCDGKCQCSKDKKCGPKCQCPGAAK